MYVRLQVAEQNESLRMKIDQVKTEDEPKEEHKITVRTPPGLEKTTKSTNDITEDIVNQYMQNNPKIVSNYLRNERAMEV